MDLDDLFPAKPGEAAILGADLSRFTVEELEARLAELESEKARVHAEIEAKQAFKSDAESVFKNEA